MDKAHKSSDTERPSSVRDSKTLYFHAVLIEEQKLFLFLHSIW
jgi:hypothetical protein